MHNKRGQGLSTNAIILIVLGVVVLAVLVIGFTMGWDKIVPWISTSNVDTIATQCGVACSTGSTYDYCDVERELKFKGTLGNLKSGEKYTCDLLSGVSGSPIEKCSGIQPCSFIEGEKEYVWVTSLDECTGEGEKIVSNSNCDQDAKGTGDNFCCEKPK
jgi:hypothetical protein